MASSSPPPAPAASGLRRLWDHGRRHRPRVLVATLFSVLNKVFDLAPPLLIGLAVDVVVRKQDSFFGRWTQDPHEQLWLLAALTLVIWVLESVFEYAYALAWRYLAQTVQHELRLDAYRHVQELELAFFEDRNTGGLMSVLNDDVNQLERFLDRGANDLLQVGTTVVVIGGYFFWLAPTIAWMAMLPMPVILWGSLHFQRRIAPRYGEVRERVGDLNADLAGNLGGIATIKAFTAEAREARRVAAVSGAYVEANRGAIRLSSAFSPLIRMVIVAGFIAFMVAGGRLALRGELEAATYTTLVFLTQRLLWPLTRLGETVDLYQRAAASTRRIFELLDTPVAIRGGSRRLPREAVRGAFRLRDVSFAYGGRAPIFEHLDLELPAGRTTAIVGATGAGKSTLLKLLLRYYDVTGGAVELDGIDLRELDLGDLRRAVGLVSQDVFLFHGTVRENIAYGRPDASDEEVRAAARFAEADAFVQALPEGYATVVGERGQKLSGGQRQRLSIARAVLADAPVLVLDEATSSVDNETEAAIQRSLAKLSVGRTTLVVAHRLSTIRHADRIHLFENGRVVESGTHEELVARGGGYAALWAVQTGEAVAPGVA
ncbi:MAG: ABC transporter ATP-binding protein [Planctomycetes bacterium]|nr:ABC transporter ATP-binding protein [Planctomycetota bacterium]